jgi:hypothetical protein
MSYLGIAVGDEDPQATRDEPLKQKTVAELCAAFTEHPEEEAYQVEVRRVGASRKDLAKVEVAAGRLHRQQRP